MDSQKIESNKLAWGQLSKEHYEHFLQLLRDGDYALNEIIDGELGDISEKSVIHLQCNTGADTILLARRAKKVTGVDLVPDNVAYATRLAADLGVKNVDFVESDVLKVTDKVHEKYDMVFTSEGVLGWLPDLRPWAKNVRALLKDGGSLYVYDSHPFELIFDEDTLASGRCEMRYPYFGKDPDACDTIGGYACASKKGYMNYFWMHTMSELLNSIIEAGMRIDCFNEYPENFYDCGGMHPAKKRGLFELPNNNGMYPMSYSLRATAY